MRAEIARFQRRLGVATLYVTHDQTEAMTMGDRVAVLRGGTLQQLADPQELYERPANLFVASFIGSPPMTFTKRRFQGRRTSSSSPSDRSGLHSPQTSCSADRHSLPPGNGSLWPGSGPNA